MMMPPDTNETVSPIQARGDAEIRERLLNKLGIFSSNDTCNEESSLQAFQPSKSRKLHQEYTHNPPPYLLCRSAAAALQTPKSTLKDASWTQFPDLLDISTEYKEPLYLEPDLFFQQEKKTQFFPQVAVVRIPSYRDYSKSMRKRLWTSLRDIRTNGERNAMEFAADNREWRKVTEEDSFIALDGELYHPETYKQLNVTTTTQQNTTTTSPPLEKLYKKKRKQKRRRNPKGNIPKRNMQKRGKTHALQKRDKVRRFLANSSAPSLTRFADT